MLLTDLLHKCVPSHLNPWAKVEQIQRDESVDLSHHSFGDGTLLAMDTFVIDRANISLSFVQPGMEGNEIETVQEVTLLVRDQCGAALSRIVLTLPEPDVMDEVLYSFDKLGVVHGEKSFVYGEDLRRYLEKVERLGISFVSDLGSNVKEIESNYNLQLHAEEPARNCLRTQRRNLVRVACFNEDGYFRPQPEEGRPFFDTIAATVGNGDHTVWVDLQSPTRDKEIPEKLATLLADRNKGIQLSEQDISTLYEFDHTPTLLERPNHVVVSAHVLDHTSANPFKFIPQEIHVFIAEGIVVTVHENETPAIDRLLEKFQSGIKGQKPVEFEALAYDVLLSVHETNYEVISRGVATVPLALEKFKGKTLKLSDLNFLATSLESSMTQLAQIVDRMGITDRVIDDLKERLERDTATIKEKERWSKDQERVLNQVNGLRNAGENVRQFVSAYQQEKRDFGNRVLTVIGGGLAVSGLMLAGLSVADDIVMDPIHAWLAQHPNFNIVPHTALAIFSASLVLFLGSGGIGYKMLQRKIREEERSLHHFDDL